MRRTTMLLTAMATLGGFSLQANAAIVLGAAGNFAVLAGSTVTNTGASIINGGNVGVSPGTAITGFPPGVVMPPFAIEPPIAAAAQGDLTTAYNAAAALPFTQNLTGQDLGGLTLLPGVYFFSAAAGLTGTLTLNDQGNPNAQFVFQIGTALTTAGNSSVVTINGGSTPGSTVFWQIGSSATLGAGSAFEGHILANLSITMNTGATLFDGSALARSGAVTLDTNTITNAVGSVPEPSTMALTFIGGAMLMTRRLRQRRAQRSESAASASSAMIVRKAD